MRNPRGKNKGRVENRAAPIFAPFSFAFLLLARHFGIMRDFAGQGL
jgi:hypothetical protein